MHNLVQQSCPWKPTIHSMYSMFSHTLCISILSLSLSVPLALSLSLSLYMCVYTLQQRSACHAKQAFAVERPLELQRRVALGNFAVEEAPRRRQRGAGLLVVLGFSRHTLRLAFLVGTWVYGTGQSTVDQKLWISRLLSEALVKPMQAAEDPRTAHA